MKIIIKLLLVMQLVFVSLYAQAQKNIDIQDFSKKYVDAIKSLDSSRIVNSSASMSFEQFKNCITEMLQDSLSPFVRRAKKRYSTLSDSLLFSEYSKLIDSSRYRNYKKIKAWIAEDSIDVSKIEFLKTYYVTNNYIVNGFALYSKVEIYCKYDSVYCVFTFNESLYTPYGFVIGRIRYAKLKDAEGEIIRRNVVEEPVLEVVEANEEKSLRRKYLEYRSQRYYDKYLKIENKLELVE